MIVLRNGILLVVELDLEVARDREDVDDGAASVGRIYYGINGRHKSDLALVSLLLIAQTAHKSAAGARDLGGIDRESLFLCHLDRDLNEVREEARAAELASADSEAADHSCLVADTDLAQFDSGAEDGCEILDKRAEIDSSR